MGCGNIKQTEKTQNKSELTNEEIIGELNSSMMNKNINSSITLKQKFKNFIPKSISKEEFYQKYKFKEKIDVWDTHVHSYNNEDYVVKNFQQEELQQLIKQEIDILSPIFNSLFFLKYQEVCIISEQDKTTGHNEFSYNLIMKKGVSLQKILQEQNMILQFEEILHNLIEMTRICTFLEYKKLVHFDFKPSKIIFADFESQQKLRIYDLGLIKHESFLNNKLNLIQNTEQWCNFRSPEFRSLMQLVNKQKKIETKQVGEIRQNEQEFMCRQNIWSLGAIFCLIFFHEDRPLCIKSINDLTIVEYIQDRLSKNNYQRNLINLPEQQKLLKLIMKMLNNEIASRPANFSEILASLNAIKAKCYGKEVEIKDQNILKEQMTQINADTTSISITNNLLTKEMLEEIIDKIQEFLGKKITIEIKIENDNKIQKNLLTVLKDFFYFNIKYLQGLSLKIDNVNSSLDNQLITDLGKSLQPGLASKFLLVLKLEMLNFNKQLPNSFNSFARCLQKVGENCFLLRNFTINFSNWSLATDDQFSEICEGIGQICKNNIDLVFFSVNLSGWKLITDKSAQKLFVQLKHLKNSTKLIRFELNLADLGQSPDIKQNNQIDFMNLIDSLMDSFSTQRTLLQEININLENLLNNDSLKKYGVLLNFIGEYNNNIENLNLNIQTNKQTINEETSKKLYEGFDQIAKTNKGIKSLSLNLQDWQFSHIKCANFVAQGIFNILKSNDEITDLSIFKNGIDNESIETFNMLEKEFFNPSNENFSFLNQ